VKLAPGEDLQYAVDVPHEDSVVAWYLQGAGLGWQDRAATALSVQVLKSGFFQQLRTEQQLGYVVAAIPWSQLDVPGMLLLIQSPNTPAPTVAASISDFMASVPGSIDREQFERHRLALVSEITKPDKNLWERAEFFWQSIAKKQYAFDGRQQMARAVREMSLESWQAYFRRVFLEQPHSLQVVSPGRWGTLPEVNGRVFHSAEQLKSDHAAYTIE
jgi:insulysin